MAGLVGCVGAVCATMIVLGPVPTAQAATEAELAEWLSTAFTPISELHTVGSAALDALRTSDMTSLAPTCPRLATANRALGALVPTPEPALTVEIQQAVDDFDSASVACDAVLAWRPNPNRPDAANNAVSLDLRRAVVTPLIAAELHLSSADAAITEIVKG